MNPQNKDIKFPAKHYVGFQVRGDGNIPLGFMTPDGDDKAAQKRKSTVDSWAASNYYGQNKPALPAKSFDNVPMSGFKMVRSVRHGGGWGGSGNVKWRVEDPRGFELEISSDNFAKIIDCSTIENGEILEKCMWARLRSENILVPVSSDLYKEAQENTERVKKSASVKDLKIGDKIIMVNGDEGIYMGRFFSVRYHPETVEVTSSDEKSHFVKRGDDDFQMYKTMKISEIIPCEKEMTEQESMRLINESLTNNGKVANYYSSNINVRAVTDNKKITVQYEYEDFDISTLKPDSDYIHTYSILIDAGGNDFGVVPATGIRRALYYFQMYNNPHHRHVHLNFMDREVYENEGKLVKKSYGTTRSWYGSEKYEDWREIDLDELPATGKKIKAKVSINDVMFTTINL